MNSAQIGLAQPNKHMATVYQTNQSRYWLARYYDGTGRRFSKSTKTESKREAKRIAGQYEAEARKAIAKAEVDSEIPAMIRRTVELAGLESQQGRLTLQRAEELIRLMHQAGCNFQPLSPTSPSRGPRISAG